MTLRLLQAKRRCNIGQAREPTIPDVGVNTPIRIRADGDMCKVVFPKRIAVDVMVVKPERYQYQDIIQNLLIVAKGTLPSDKRNQAARNLNAFLSFLISAQLNIPMSLFHAATISFFVFHSASSFSKSSTLTHVESKPELSVALRSHKAAGMENMAHQTPLRPIASLNEKVEPCKSVTGISVSARRTIPDEYPRAMPRDEMRDVAFESSVLYLCLRSRALTESNSGSCNRGASAWSSFDSGSCVTVSGSGENPSSSVRARTTFSDPRASRGRYAFIATTDAPKPTFASIASTPDNGQKDEDDGSRRKRIADDAPIDAKPNNSRFRWGAAKIVH